MNHFTEEDYRDLVRHIVDRLEGCGAKGILRQIQNLETVSVAEPADDKEDIAAHQMPQYEIVLPLDPASKHAKKGKKGSERYSFRPMTYQEIYCAAVDILEAYLVIGPKMTETLKEELLAEYDLRDIDWKFESENRIDSRQENSPDAFKRFSQLSSDMKAEINQIIQVLKNAGGKEQV